jgi:hypothetical protein
MDNSDTTTTFLDPSKAALEFPQHMARYTGTPKTFIKTLTYAYTVTDHAALKKTGYSFQVVQNGRAPVHLSLEQARCQFPFHIFSQYDAAQSTFRVLTKKINETFSIDSQTPVTRNMYKVVTPKVKAPLQCQSKDTTSSCYTLPCKASAAWNVQMNAKPPAQIGGDPLGNNRMPGDVLATKGPYPSSELPLSAQYVQKYKQQSTNQTNWPTMSDPIGSKQPAGLLYNNGSYPNVWGSSADICRTDFIERCMSGCTMKDIQTCAQNCDFLAMRACP